MLFILGPSKCVESWKVSRKVASFLCVLFDVGTCVHLWLLVLCQIFFAIWYYVLWGFRVYIYIYIYNIITTYNIICFRVNIWSLFNLVFGFWISFLQPSRTLLSNRVYRSCNSFQYICFFWSDQTIFTLSLYTETYKSNRSVYSIKTNKQIKGFNYVRHENILYELDYMLCEKMNWYIIRSSSNNVTHLIWDISR